MCPGLQAWVPPTNSVTPVKFGISLCLHVSAAELQPGCSVRGTLASPLGAQAVEPLFLTHARSLGVTGSSAAHGRSGPRVRSVVSM